MSDHHSCNFIIGNNVSLPDFARVYKTFSYAPYHEKWSDDDIKITYDTMLKDGKIFGVYEDTYCVGIITLTEKNQPLKFTNKALFIADLAVLNNYRKFKITDMLLEFAINYAKDNEFKLIYLRTLEKDNSLDYESFINKNFRRINGVCQVVKMERTRICKDEDCRFFMKFNLN